MMKSSMSDNYIELGFAELAGVIWKKKLNASP